MEIARLGCACDVCAETIGLQALIAPDATSATMLAFHEPPDAVIAPVT